MSEFIINSIIYILSIYGLMTVIKEAVRIITYTKLKSNGLYLIIAVKNQENKIEFFLRNLLFRIIYGKEEYIKNIIVADLNSEDSTREILNNLEKEYECINVVNWDECKELVENINK